MENHTSTTTHSTTRTLFFVVNVLLPNERAHGIQILHMCNAFAQSGVKVVLVIPKHGTCTDAHIRDFYAIPQHFAITWLPAFSLPIYKSGSITFLLRWFSFSFFALLYLITHGVKNDIVYVRGEMILPAALLPSKFFLCFETHIRPARMGLYARAMRRCSRIITVTKLWADELITEFKFPQSAIIVEPDAVDMHVFGTVVGKESARRTLGLPQDKTILVYAGSDRPWKGLAVVKEAALLLTNNFLVVFVGDIRAVHADDPRCMYVGFARHETIPLWLSASDFLILTGHGDAPESQRYTSPLKLFEYMAARRPVIASDVPSFREILDDTSAFFISTTDPNAIATRIMAIDSNEAHTKAESAFRKVQAHTWNLRAERILAHINQ